MTKKYLSLTGVVFTLLTLWACGGSGTNNNNNVVDVIEEILSIPYGQTSLVFGVNPVVNDVDEATSVDSGPTQEAVLIEPDTGSSVTTDANGLAVMTPVDAGVRTMSLSGGTTSGSVDISIADKDLREVAVASDESGSTVIANTLYSFSNKVVEITSDMSIGDVNAALTESDTIVYLRSGVYEGDIVFDGDGITLFGEGETGGTVILDGTITVDGSTNRIRGATIKGDLHLNGSDSSVSFSRVEGDTTVLGSDVTLLYNELCGAFSVTASGLTALGNEGLDPIAAPSDCP